MSQFGDGTKTAQITYRGGGCEHTKTGRDREPPSRTAFRSLARQNPRQYVQTLKDLAELNGYATRSERIEVKHDARSMALELVNRVGRERATEILADFGLPASLIPAQTQPEAIDGEIVERAGSKSGESTDPHSRHTDTDTEND